MSFQAPTISVSEIENDALTPGHQNPNTIARAKTPTLPPNLELPGPDNRSPSPATILFQQVPYPPPIPKSLDESIRLTVVNETNPRIIVDTVRVELRLRDKVIEALKIVCHAKRIRRRATVKLVNYWGVDLNNDLSLAESGLHDLSVVRLRMSGVTCNKDDPEWAKIDQNEPKNPIQEEFIPLVVQPAASIKPKPVASSVLRKRSPLCCCCCLVGIILLILALLVLLLLLILILIPGSSFKRSVLIETASENFEIRKFRWRLDSNAKIENHTIEQYVATCKTENGTNSPEETTTQTVSCINSGSMWDYDTQDLNSTLLFMIDYEKNAKELVSIRKSIVQSLFNETKENAIKSQHLSEDEKLNNRWIAINYLTKSLYPLEDSSQEEILYGNVHSEGTKIVFVGVDESTGSTLEINNKQYRVHTSSQKCFNLETIKIKYLKELINGKDAAQDVVHMNCYTSDTNSEIDPNELISQDEGTKNNCDLTLPNEKFKFNGTINMESCKEDISKLLADFPSSTSTAKSNSHFYVTGELMNLANELGIDQDTNLTEIVESTCADDSDWKCFKVLYFKSLIEEKYKLNLTLVQFEDKISGQEIHWTLGYMIDQAYKNPTDSEGSERTGYLLPLIVYCILLTILIILLIAAIVCLVIGCIFCCCCKQAQNSQCKTTRVYLP